MPATLNSDQRANLTSNLVSALCKLLGITQTQTTAYHPQEIGQVEQFNCTLQAILAKTVSDNQHDWDTHLPKALFAYRTAVHKATGFTPFHVTFEHSPMLPIYILIGTLPTQHKEAPAFVADLNRLLSAVYSTVRTNLHSAHQHNKARYDKKSTSNHYSVGDIVWLYNPAVKTGQTKKLASLWRGPYTVVDRTNSVNYRIRLIGSPSNQK